MEAIEGMRVALGAAVVLNYWDRYGLRRNSVPVHRPVTVESGLHALGVGASVPEHGDRTAEEELGPRSSTCDRGIRRMKSLLDETPRGVDCALVYRRSPLAGIDWMVCCDVRSMDSSWISTGSCSSCDSGLG
ncbi:hypothetical protein LWI29_021539 [Acer saccharum]|uniref:Uncharacterized protein n=1 Tax=Acer saccharum TaxID=4024 RepID=A0AA39VXU8_ACESA|nr:hypothetical protein LWI29_021539 [Acer saccharum]